MSSRFPGFAPLRDFFARAAREPVLSIMIFHRVLAKSDPMVAGAVTHREFSDIARLVRQNFACYPLSEAVARLDAGTPGHMVSMTFDDGYADNFEIALPVLRRYGLPATVFVAARYLDGGIMWNDVVGEAIAKTRRPKLDCEYLDGDKLHLDSILERQHARKRVIGTLKYLPQGERERRAWDLARRLDVVPRSDLMLTRGQLKRLADDPLIEIGGHTYSHPILARTDEAAAVYEMSEGKKILEAITQQPVAGFAYPNGQPGRDYRPEHARMARDTGFAYAVSTEWGAARTSADRFQLPRFTPWHRKRLRFMMSLLKMARKHCDVPRRGDHAA